MERCGWGSHVLLQARMHPVGADHDVGHRTHSVGKDESCLLLVLRKADTSVVGVDDLGRKPADEHVEQVGPVHSVELDLAREFGRPHRRGKGSVRTAELRIDPFGAQTKKLIAESQPLQHAHAVWLDGNAGANLSEGRGLLIKADVHTALNESRSCGSTTDAAADDGDTKWMLCHAIHLSGERRGS